MVFDSQFHKVFNFPPCGIVLDHFRPRPPRPVERDGQVESDPNKTIFSASSACSSDQRERV